ncbi:MAG: response regulator [Deltaproteobacteria bacterium]|nr:response regulator [Deltaproteobacteria bacterium]
MKVLVADDDITTALFLERQLKQFGYNVQRAENGTQVWDIMHSYDAPSLLVLDWMMPGMDGIEICKRLRDEQGRDHVYIIVLTARTEKSALLEALAAGADDYLCKPVDLPELRLRLRCGERIVKAGRNLKDLNQELTVKQEILAELNQTLDERVKRRTRQLEEALKVAEHSVKMKSAFLANMSHEIRTPLNGIVSYVELLLGSKLTEEQKEDLLTVRNSVFHLRTIINDILDFSKIEADRMVIDNSPFNLTNMVRETTDILAVEFDRQKLTFVEHIEDSVPANLIGDRVRVQQVITNFLSNAIKFSSHNGAIILHIDCEWSSGRDLMLHIAVADTGIGIPEEKQQEVFEAFTQADSSTTRRYGGTGLGLAICKKLVTLMDGKIWVKSKVGIGTTFHVSVPVKVAGKAEERPKGPVPGPVWRATQAVHCGSAIGSIRVLLAEDNLINQLAMQRILQQAGLNVTAVDNGIAVLNCLKQEKFDLILMDIQMPYLSGDEATRRIRSGEGGHAGIPIIALTGNAVLGDREHYLSQGMNGYVSKPIDYGQLYRTMREVMGIPGAEGATDTNSVEWREVQ